MTQWITVPKLICEYTPCQTRLLNPKYSSDIKIALEMNISCVSRTFSLGIFGIWYISYKLITMYTINITNYNIGFTKSLTKVIHCGQK